MPKTILVVDDEESIRNALRRSLSREGYQLLFAAEPNDALAQLAKNPVDLVISDHLMPNMTGLEFLTLVRDRYPDCMRLILTGHADMQTAINAINKGEIYRFLTKPWDDFDLQVTLRLALEQLDLQRANRKLLTVIRQQKLTLETMEREHPGITALVRDERGAILVDPEELSQLVP